MPTAPIGLFGATGTLGSRIATGLDARGICARLLLRRPEAAESYRFHKVVHADLDDPPSLAAAFEGIETLVLITADSPRQDHQGVAAIEAAQEAGVSRVLLVSAMLAHPGPDRQLGAQHHRIETALRSSGMQYVVLRPAFFMQSFKMVLGDLTRGRLIAPVASARVAFVDACDVAEAVIRCVEDWPRALSLDDPMVLTGAESLTFAEVASELSRVSSAPVRHLSPSLCLVALVLRFRFGSYMLGTWCTFPEA